MVEAVGRDACLKPVPKVLRVPQMPTLGEVPTLLGAALRVRFGALPPPVLLVCGEKRSDPAG